MAAAPSSAVTGEDVSAYLSGLLENRRLWSGWQTYFYADSASSADKYMEVVDAHFGNWSISYNKWTGPLEKACMELADEFLSQEEEIKWRDGRQHIVQHAFVRHQPEGLPEAESPCGRTAQGERRGGILGLRLCRVPSSRQGGAFVPRFLCTRMVSIQSRLQHFKCTRSATFPGIVSFQDHRVQSFFFASPASLSKTIRRSSNPLPR